MAVKDIALAIAVVLLAGIITSRIYNALCGPRSAVPGPLLSRFTSLPLKLAVLSGKRIHYVHELHKKYGPVVLVGPEEVSACSVEAFKTIYHARSPFVKSEWYLANSYQRKPAIFNLQERHLFMQRRKTLMPGLQKTVVRRDYETSTREFAHQAVARIKGECVETGESDILKWFSFLSTDVAGKAMFGESFKMLESGVKAPFMRAVENTMQGLGLISEFPWIEPFIPFVPSKAFQELFGSIIIVMKYAENAVYQAKNPSHPTVFSRMFTDAEKDVPFLSDEDIQFEAANLIVAGSDTTSVTLVYTIWAVLQQPETQRALEEELAALTEDDLTDEILEKLPVLSAILAETLRLYGSAPGCFPRIVPPGGGVLEGYAIPERTIVSSQTWTLHRDPRLWGESADVFDHTRWMRPDGVGEEALAIYKPFGGDPRSCIGLNLAWMELRLGTAIFFRECRGAKMAGSMKEGDMDVEHHFLNRPAGHKCLVSLGKKV